MKTWGIFLKVMILIIGAIAIAFDVLFYNFCEKQKMQIDTMSKQQQIDTQVNDNKFKYQQEQIERLSKDLEGALQQIKDQNDSYVQQKDALTAQKDALLQEVQKRQQIENESKSVQISLVDIKAEADAIKQDIKGWQKDYVSILAELEKKMDDSQGEIKSVKDDLDAFEKLTHPPDNGLPKTLPAPVKQPESTQSQS